MIEPLRKLTRNDTLYTRPPEIEAKLVELYELSREALAERCKIQARSDPAYVPSECLVHFVRACRADNSDRHFETLYKLLMERAHKACPRPEAGDGKTASMSRLKVREKVLDRLAELFAADRQTYVEALDYFEIRFDAAIARRRQDAQDQVRRADKRTISIDIDDESGDVPAEIEKAAAEFNPFHLQQTASLDDRLRLDAAIEDLPPLQRRIIEMLRLEIPIDSKDPNVVTIAKVLDVAEKTVRLNRNKAIAVLQAKLAGED